MNCRKCGENIATKFCPYCGAAAAFASVCENSDKDLYLNKCKELGCKPNSLLTNLLLTNQSHLDLSNNYLGEKNVAALACVLQVTDTIEAVTLTNNNITNNSVQVLVEALKQQHNVTYLNLSNNPVSFVGGRRLLSLIKRNPFLQTIELENTYLNKSLAQAINTQLLQNQQQHPEEQDAGLLDMSTMSMTVVDPAAVDLESSCWNMHVKMEKEWGKSSREDWDQKVEEEEESTDDRSGEESGDDEEPDWEQDWEDDGMVPTDITEADEHAGEHQAPGEGSSSSPVHPPPPSDAASPPPPTDDDTTITTNSSVVPLDSLALQTLRPSMTSPSKEMDKTTVDTTSGSSVLGQSLSAWDEPVADDEFTNHNDEEHNSDTSGATKTASATNSSSGTKLHPHIGSTPTPSGRSGGGGPPFKRNNMSQQPTPTSTQFTTPKKSQHQQPHQTQQQAQTTPNVTNASHFRLVQHINTAKSVDSGSPPNNKLPSVAAIKPSPKSSTEGGMGKRVINGGPSGARGSAIQAIKERKAVVGGKPKTAARRLSGGPQTTRNSNLVRPSSISNVNTQNRDTTNRPVTYHPPSSQRPSSAAPHRADSERRAPSTTTTTDTEEQTPPSAPSAPPPSSATQQQSGEALQIVNGVPDDVPVINCVQQGKPKKGAKKKGGGEQVIKTIPATVRCAGCVGNNVWTGLRSNVVEIRDAKTAEIVSTFTVDGLPWCINNIFNHSVWIGTEKGHIQVYHPKTFKYIKTITQHIGGIYTILTTNQNNIRSVWTGSLDFTINRWDATGKFMKLFSGHTNGVRAILHLGPVLWSGSSDKTIRIWDIVTAHCTAVLEGHTASILSLVAAGSYVISSGEDNTFRAWSVADQTCIKVVDCGYRVNGLTRMGPKEIWSSGQHPNIHVWNLQEMSCSKQLQAHSTHVNQITSVHHVETRIVWSSSMADNTLRIWKQENRMDSDPAEDLAIAQASNAAHQGEYDRLMNKLKDYEERINQIDQLESQLAAMRQDRDDARKENEQLRNEIADLRDQLQRSESACRGLEERVRQLEDELARAKRTIAELEEKLRDSTTLNDQLTNDLNNERNKNKTLTDEKKQLEELVESLQKQLVDLQNELSVEKQKNQLLTDKLQNIDGNRLELQDKLKEALDEVDQLKKRVTELEKQLADMTSSRDELQLINTALNEKNDILRNTVMDLEEELEREKAAHGETKAKLRKTELELERALEKIRYLEDEAAKLKELVDYQRNRINEMEIKNQELQDKVNDLEDQLRSAAEREEELNKRFAELDVFKLDIIARELKKLENEIGSIRGKCQSYLAADVKRMKDFTERENAGAFSRAVMDGLAQNRAHIKDVIKQCLNETQKMHIGSAVEDPMAAGQLPSYHHLQ